jgi:bifunctional enzyme CysN/CysC
LIMPAGSTGSAKTEQDRDLVRIVVCGSVDDGKSTLIGKLLAETGSVPDDQLAALATLSHRYGTTGADPDYALLLDGLEAEREQGITIDVAHRYLSTATRTFVIADVPGHEQYTRNMVSGASDADVVVLLVDVRQGITTQTIRHSRIAALLGIRHVLLIVNKMDLVDFSEPAFTAVRDRCQALAGELGFVGFAAIPVSARHGENITRPSARMPWYEGATMLAHLEATEFKIAGAAKPLRFLVQSVIRAEKDYRGIAGLVSSGLLSRGDSVIVARSALATRVERIVTMDGDLERATIGQAVSLVLADHVDVGRGDVLVHPDAGPEMADQFAADVVWFDESPLLPGRTYSLRFAAQTVAATVTALKHKVEVETGIKAASRTLHVSEFGFCNFATTTPIALDAYADNRATGGFLVIDRASAATAGAGMIAFPLRRAANVKRQQFKVDRTMRARMKAQIPAVIWFTGLPSAGKSTIMNLVEQHLTQHGVHTYALDGDNLRRGLNRDLGFTDVDRVENIRRAGEIAGLMVDAGLVVLCAFISPFHAERRMVREMFAPGEFIEVFVDTPLSVCMARDPKGLYAKAREGKVQHVTGLDSPYEPPEQPDLRIDASEAPPEALASQVVQMLIQRGIVR